MRAEVKSSWINYYLRGRTPKKKWLECGMLVDKKLEGRIIDIVGGKEYYTEGYRAG